MREAQVRENESQAANAAAAAARQAELARAAAEVTQHLAEDEDAAEHWTDEAWDEWHAWHEQGEGAEEEEEQEEGDEEDLLRELRRLRRERNQWRTQCAVLRSRSGTTRRVTFEGSACVAGDDGVLTGVQAAYQTAPGQGRAHPGGVP